MFTPITREKYESLPESERVCRVFGNPLTYDDYIEATGYYSHITLKRLRASLGLPLEEFREAAKTFLKSPIHGGYYRTWKALAIAENALGATEEQLEATYNELIYPTSQCKFPGCSCKVPFSMRALGYCCTLHANQGKRIARGDYTVDDLKYECAIDGFKFVTKEGVAKHLRDDYNYTDEQMEEYYLKYVYQPGMPDGKCKYCGAPVKFKSLVHGYDSFCHNKDCTVRWYNENTDRLVKSGEGIKKAHSKGDVIPTQVAYWLKRGCSQDEAEQKVRERQTTNSVQAIMEREGCSEDEAREIRKGITDKWLQSRATGLNWSRVSQELFWELWNNHLKGEFSEKDVFFATFNEGELDESKNREYRLDTKRSYRLADFYIESLDISIEFDGEFHHGNTGWRGADFDKQRDEEIIEGNPGHQIIHIKETAYRKDKQSQIQACLDFINHWKKIRG